MARKSKKSLESAFPGWTVEEIQQANPQGVDAMAAERDMVGPDFSALKEKYLPHGSGGHRVGSPLVASDAEAAPAVDQDGWARLRDDGARDSAIGPKAVLFDKKTKRVKAVQG